METILDNRPDWDMEILAKGVRTYLDGECMLSWCATSSELRELTHQYAEIAKSYFNRVNLLAAAYADYAITTPPDMTEQLAKIAPRMPVFHKFCVNKRWAFQAMPYHTLSTNKPNEFIVDLGGHNQLPILHYNIDNLISVYALKSYDYQSGYVVNVNYFLQNVYFPTLAKQLKANSRSIKLSINGELIHPTCAVAMYRLRSFPANVDLFFPTADARQLTTAPNRDTMRHASFAQCPVTGKWYIPTTINQVRYPIR